MTKPRIEVVDWPAIEHWLRSLAPIVEAVDGIVGVARSGAPMATALSYLWPTKHLAFATRRDPRGSKDAFYVFDAGRDSRFERNRKSIFVSELPETVTKILVLDDVATFGDTLECVRERLEEMEKRVSVSFACYAVDAARLGEARPDILSRTSYSIDIDNSKIWMSFPWQLLP